MALGFGQKIFDDLDLAQRGGVEMADARIPKILEDGGMGIGLDGIERRAGKDFQKMFRRGAQLLVLQHIDRNGWLQAFKKFPDGGKTRQRIQTADPRKVRALFEADESGGQEKARTPGWRG
jgi:hypothetical protein